MGKILPINTKPYMRTYTFHGFHHSILSSNEKVNYNIDEEVADVTVKNFSLYKWNIQNDRLKYRIDHENNLKFYTNQWNLGMNIAFWRECKKKDVIDICINKQLYSNVWSSVTLFLTDEKQMDMIDPDRYAIRTGNLSKDGIYYLNLGEAIVTQKSHPNLPVRLKLKKANRKVYLEYCDENLKTQKVLIRELDKHCQLQRIGFIINFRDNSYYEWTFSNYVQVFSDTSEQIPIDFILNDRKNWYVYTSNYFIDYTYKYENEIKLYGFSLIEYIQKQIDLNRYIEIENNDNLHSGDLDSNGKLFHQNLIYGYDDEKQLLYIMYYRFGNAVFTTMSYQDFLSDRNRQVNPRIFILQYNPGYEEYKLSKRHLLQIYKEFRDGENISYYQPFYENGYKIGIKCYEYFCTQKGVQDLISDYRIGHFLYEHTLCNRDRVQYLCCKGYIEEEKRNEMVDILEKIMYESVCIRSIAMKHYMGGKINQEYVEHAILEIYENEKRFTSLIIKELEK